jgi:hypothetical protein
MRSAGMLQTPIGSLRLVHRLHSSYGRVRLPTFVHYRLSEATRRPYRRKTDDKTLARVWTKKIREPELDFADSDESNFACAQAIIAMASNEKTMTRPSANTGSGRLNRA